MTKSGFLVKQSGVYTTVQDGGRLNALPLGVTTGGVMDEYAYLWANQLLGNALHTPQLEVTIGGLQLIAQVDTCVVVTGAQCTFTINGIAKPLWHVHTISRGDEIKLGYARRGVYSYFAVMNGFICADMWGSCATVEREKIGGFNQDGSKIAQGDLLACHAVGLEDMSGLRSLSPKFIPHYYGTNEKQVLPLRLIPGYQFDALSQPTMDYLLAHRFQVTSHSDRMGYRLRAQHNNSTSASTINPLSNMNELTCSQGISFAAVQVPPSGEPIILLKDRQTLGGYPVLGNILPVDAFRLSQCTAGCTVQFKLIEPLQAIAIQRIFYQQFMRKPSR
ncbi:5-oxoprolinase subunit C family protein [Flocculibacter collagenilyticus]|uniref:5-oxoprolinase subunit C family protein n=1 Tax=Flocculibacter collagenilyticus TaxID=2744479 RepID=UPI0018F6150E|nr:biotin-dependent carboxyltransferase family protein [Flocculibacter collagenilyticus]